MSVIDDLDAEADQLRWWEWLMPLAVVAIVIARGFWGASLWLDETLSSWVVQDGVAHVWSRATTYQPQSLLYFYVLAGWQEIAGDSEVAMRALSGVWLLVALVGLYLLVRGVSGPRAALAACLILIVCDPILKALSVRPYSMALALTIWSLVATIKWLKSSSGAARCWHLLLAVAAGYTQVTFIGFLIVPVLWWLALPKKRSGREVLTNFVFVLVLTSPILWHTYAQLSQLPRINVGPDIVALARSLVPGNLLVYVLCGALVALISVTGARPVRMSRQLLVTAATWHALPVLALFCLAFVTGAAFFIDRYYIWALPGTALVCAILLTSFTNQTASRVALCVAALLMFGRESGRHWQVEDWRGAVGVVNEAGSSDTAVLVYPGLVEADIPTWLEDPKRTDYLAAPLQRYRLTQPFRVLPSQVEGAEMRNYLLDSVIPDLERVDRVFLIANAKFNQRLQVGVTGYYAQILSELGFKVEWMSNYGAVSVLEMKR